ncbi:MAG TPA: hypothetical protein VGQ99_15880 [Tepidisphaeraceae bacterium]|nr:hypothetical protein [Tepidisphaeraceae bacterium]
MPAKEKKEATASGSVRPTRLPQVNNYLRQHGIKDVRLDRGHGYFTFWGVPIDHWLNRVVVGRLDALTLNDWLEKYRELEKQNKSTNPLGAKKTSKK